MLLNTDGLLPNQKAVGDFINEHEAKIGVINESNMAENTLELAKIPAFDRKKCRCRKFGNAKGRGGGGVLITIIYAIPNLAGVGKSTQEQREMK